MRQVPEVQEFRAQAAKARGRSQKIADGRKTEAARAARSAKFVVDVKRQRGRPKYSIPRGSPAFGLTSYRPAQAHNLLGSFPISAISKRRCVCTGIAMAVAGGRFRHESCSLDLVSVIIAAGRRAGHVSIRSGGAIKGTGSSS